MKNLKKALSFLSDRSNPDFANSVKESISAVESECSIVLGDEHVTLGKMLDKMEKDKTRPLAPSLATAFSKLYGYTSNADGVRHGGMEPAKIDKSLATFFLVTCSAFVNYLKQYETK